MNEKGSFLLEALLTLAVIVVVFGTLLPLTTQITSKLYDKKLAMHAADTAYYGTILYRSHQLTAGVRVIDGQYFDWLIDGGSVCVSYAQSGKGRTKCVEF